MATFASCSTRLAERARALDPAWRWAVGIALGGRLAYTLWSLVILWLVPFTVQNLDLFGNPVVVFFDLATSESLVYSRQVGERVLSFRPSTDGTISDVETGSVWLLREGKAVAGELAGASLGGAAYTAEDVFPYKGVTAEQGWFGIWQRFDVLWYQAIAENGYAATPGGIHFPPFYPALQHILGKLLGGRFFFAGWLIAQVALIGALAVLYRLTEQWRDQTIARRTVVFLILFPTAFFLFTAYSESLFLLLSLLSFAALQRQAWLWAGFWAFLAILTRLQGIALLAPLAYCVWSEWRSGKLGTLRLAPLLALGLPLAASAFYVGLRALVGEGYVLPTHEPGLNARLALPWENVVVAITTIASGKFLVADLLNLGALLLGVSLVVLGWRELSREYSLYVAATLVVASLRLVDTQPLNSMSRYVLTLFPLFMLLARWSKNRWVERAVIYGSVPLNLYLTAQFLVWGWVA